MLRADTFAAHAFSRLIVHSAGTATSGTVLAAFPDRLLPPPDPPPSWTDIFREHLDPQLRWRIYTDGSWRAALSPTPHDFFLEPGGMQGGGCIVVTQDSADWATAPIYVLPFTVPSTAEEYGGTPLNMELLAISAGLELLEDLGLRGTVFTDCQGLVKKLLHPQVLRRTPASAGFPLIRACARRLHPLRTLQWVRSHPERSRTPRTAWDQSQWGIFFADRYARSPSAPPEPGFPLQIAEPISYVCIAKGAIRPDDWHWATAGHAPLLGALGRTVHAVSLSAYLSHRDTSRASRGAPPYGRAPRPDTRRRSGPWASGALLVGGAKPAISGIYVGTGKIRPLRTRPTARPSHAAGSAVTHTAASTISYVNAPVSPISATACAPILSYSPPDNSLRRSPALCNDMFRCYLLILFPSNAATSG